MGDVFWEAAVPEVSEKPKTLLKLEEVFEKYNEFVHFT